MQRLPGRYNREFSVSRRVLAAPVGDFVETGRSGHSLMAGSATKPTV